MENTEKVTGNDLLAIGFPAGKAIGLALELAADACYALPKEAKLEEFRMVLENPVQFSEHPVFASLAGLLLTPKEPKTLSLRAEKVPYEIYGPEAIEEGALKQMETAMRLPVTVAGALMPDAHQGYGLPIGGVLATENSVIPYAVGVDIGCRMCLSIYDLPASYIDPNRDNLKRMLIDNTRFGTATFKRPQSHAIIDRPEFQDMKLLRTLKDKAYKQLGSSGGGNHFVEFGTVEIMDPQNEFNLPVGTYFSVLSHSGSRGLGATIAGHYTKVAMANCPLPQEARHLAWLDLNTEAGQEYWLAMNLAGDYASACHHQIHDRMAASLGVEPIAMVENHHNFAWKETDATGRELIVHRKGATPAGKGVLGMIPGSMSTPGFIVRGKGLEASVNSASHGAGRTMSRTKAKNTLNLAAVQQHLLNAGVDVIGSGLDEAPMAYKNIHQVMEFQKDLVEVIGTFTPKIVRMCGDEKYMEVD
ncbi:RtcB family protein [Adhaeribacter sp. BT258]|uniref:3'-phosphate/5'-hydroxy nucleic acid ligase n=1 Tax=Adhaeribacter terrigena TaxID=2793070 RepID=A0ABS1BZU8_9BACT|nr:RtcB family protein [Adhaeribacter terrigena]MBK0402614.1 RtcB family protein [Adhaeribacter terrigena]